MKDGPGLKLHIETEDYSSNYTSDFYVVSLLLQLTTTPVCLTAFNSIKWQLMHLSLAQTKKYFICRLNTLHISSFVACQNYS